MSEPRAVMFLAHTAGIGGAELALLDLVDALRTHTPFRITVVVPGTGFLESSLRKMGVNVELLPLPLAVSWTSSLLTNLKARLKHGSTLGKLGVLLRKHRPRVVVSTTSVLWVGAFAAALWRKPHVWWIHEDPWAMDYAWIFPEPWLRRLLRKRHTHPVFVSSHLRQVWEEHIPELRGHGEVLPQWIPVHEPSETRTVLIPPDAFHLVVVGMYHPLKGQADAVRALARLRQPGRPVHLWLVGDGPLRGSLQKLARQLNVEDRVHLTGVVPPDQVAAYLRQAHLVLHPSHQESLGRSLLEAMALGMPAVAAALPVYRSLGMRHRVQAWFYPPGDVERLAEAVTFLLAHPEVRARMAREGQRWVRTQIPDLTRGVKAWRELLEAVARG